MTRVPRHERPERGDLIPAHLRVRIGVALLIVGLPLLIVGEGTNLWEYGMSFFGLLACMFGVGLLFPHDSNQSQGGDT